ncbi:MAG: putative membrane protein YkgB, partial [Bacteroidia bacterium]
LFVQMPGTFLPLVLLPEVCFTQFPLGLTLEGQYIIKNLILISAALVIGGQVRQKT